MYSIKLWTNHIDINLTMLSNMFITEDTNRYILQEETFYYENGTQKSFVPYVIIKTVFTLLMNYKPFEEMKQQRNIGLNNLHICNHKLSCKT